MLTRLRTVRAKLTALVGLSVVMMLAALPLLSWVLHRQMLDEVDDRVVEAEKAYEAELGDDLADLELAARVLGADTDTSRALHAHDGRAARGLAEIFVGVYPDIDVLIADETGAVVAQVGCTSAPPRLDAVPELEALVLARTHRAIVRHGCESGARETPPAMVIASLVAGGGTVVVCMPLGAKYLANTSAKLGLELGLSVGDGGATIATTLGFPPSAMAIARHEATPLEEGPHAWAVARFEPRAFEAPTPVSVVAALDVTDVRDIIRKNLLFVLAVLLFATVVSVVVGTRLASIMSVALSRVNDALKKLAQQEYVHVETVHTGDELEDLAAGFNTMVDGLKERDKLKATMGKYMTASVMDHLMAGKVALGGEIIPVTILFTDIRSFASISERMGAKELVALLNEYFTEMVGIVMSEDGVVDKYIGDAIMAVFGAPVPKPRDAIHAVRAAVNMRHALSHLNARLVQRGIAALRTGIGVHTGLVVAGNIGSERRMEYTVIGDAVNLASRLESNTKDLGVPILISHDTYLLTRDEIVTRPVKEIIVKGRAAPVMTYEVLGIRGEAVLEATSDMRRSAPPAPEG